MTRTNNGGFTLSEALLVIAIGGTLLASGTILYQQYRRSAADSAAIDKVVALQAQVEHLYVVNRDTYPSVTQLAGVWQQRRPIDYNMSPWGGFAQIGTDIASGLGGGDCPEHYAASASPGTRGALYYWTAGPTASNSQAAVATWDDSGGDSQLRGFRYYLVGIVPNSYPDPNSPPYLFVRGGPPTDVEEIDALSGRVGYPAPGSADDSTDVE
ncbi:hypothetical protein D3C86_1167460 [compost metagenome]